MNVWQCGQASEVLPTQHDFTGAGENGCYLQVSFPVWANFLKLYPLTYSDKGPLLYWPPEFKIQPDMAPGLQ